MSAAEETARFNALRAWMLGLRCCYLCAVGLAIAAVEREAGRPKFEVTHRCRREVELGRSVSCAEIVRARWAERPGARKRVEKGVSECRA